jgi:hypothetical protein
MEAAVFRGINISLMNQQFVVTHTIPQNEIPALLGIVVKMLYPQKNLFSLYIRQNLTCLNVVPLRIWQILFCLVSNCISSS